MDKLRIGYVSNAVGTAPVWSACDAGYFQALGLDVEPVFIPDSGKLTTALESGDIQFSNFAAPAIMMANMERGTDFVFIAGSLNRLMQSLCSRPGITSIDQLKGGKIGLKRRDRGEVNPWIIAAILPRLGLRENDNIQIVLTGGSSGKEWNTKVPVDALVLHQPQPFEAANDGWTILQDLRQLDIPFQLASVAARRQWIDRNRDVAQRYVEGYVEGLLRFNSDQDFAVKVQQKWGPTTDEGICTQTHDFVCGEFAPRPYPTEAAIRTILEVMAPTVPQADPDRAADFIDPSFVARMEQSGLLGDLIKQYQPI
jgi:ABC-type nitrate/sulfonate/bicarbonate transport system substrate-binding protein